MSGPMTDASAKHMPMSAMYCAREWSGVISATMTIAPLKMPAAPAPAIARPRISTSMLGATPHTSEPTSKMKTAKRMTCLDGKIWRNWA
jgi:hypothetical protein